LTPDPPRPAVATHSGRPGNGFPVTKRGAALLTVAEGPGCRLFAGRGDEREGRSPPAGRVRVGRAAGCSSRSPHQRRCSPTHCSLQTSSTQQTTVKPGAGGCAILELAQLRPRALQLDGPLEECLLVPARTGSLQRRLVQSGVRVRRRGGRAPSQLPWIASCRDPQGRPSCSTGATAPV